MEWLVSISQSLHLLENGKKWNQPSQDLPQDLVVSSMGIVPQILS